MATYPSFGGSLAWTTVLQPARFHVLFSGRPSAAGGCHTQTLLFWPAGSGRRLLQAAALMYGLLRDDRRILDHLQFRPAFTEHDVALRTFAGAVNAMETW